MSNRVIDPKDELLIISYVTKMDPRSVQLGDETISDKQHQQIEKLVEMRLDGMPIDYVIGEVEFFGNQIGISKDVLIPRPETEILVERCVEVIQKEPFENKTALDLCTGSGCIGLALKRACPLLKVIISDVSPSALGVAKNNAKRNNLDVECVLGHLFDGLKGDKIDFLICNPPYIPEKEYQNLSSGVKNYEPKLALQGGNDGLMFYRMIEKEAKNFLNHGARCFFEIGYNQGASVNQIFSSPLWGNREVSTDYSGHDRFFFLEFCP